MRKQNVIILIVFVCIIVGFYVGNYFINKSEDEIITKKTEEVKTSEYVSCYVFGEVNRSDTYKIPSSWTVGMLFELAGLKTTADLSCFDLSMLVENNKNYYVPSKNKVDESLLININTASLEELVKLPSIGEVIALRIIEYRQKNPFKDKEEIKNVKGIGDAIYEKIKGFITV